MKKRISVMIAALLLVLGLSSSVAFAEDGMFFYDDAGILTQTELERVDTRLQEVSDGQQCGVYVKTTDDFNGKTPNEYADDFYDGSGLGYGDDKSGIILVVNYDSGDWALSTTGYGITCFTDTGQEYIMDYVVQFLRDDPETAFTAYADLCEEFIMEANAVEPYDGGNMPDYGDLILPGYYESDYYSDEDSSSYSQVILPIDIAIGIAIGVIIALIIMLIQKSGLKTVRRQAAAKNYIRQGSFNLTVQNEQFLYSNVERIKKEDDPPSTGSSTHTGSSGTTHGGSSGKF